MNLARGLPGHPGLPRPVRPSQRINQPEPEGPLRSCMSGVGSPAPSLALPVYEAGSGSNPSRCAR